MAKYKKYDYSQMVMIPVSLKNQLMPGTFEHIIHEVIEKKVHLSIFDENYKNDETGAPAHDPKLLLKVILLAFSRGMTGSRKIEKACGENVTFMALSCGMAPDHSTIAHFISSMKEEIIHIFRDVLLYCSYIPDTDFRKRDERYKSQDRFKDGVNKPPKKMWYNPKRKTFSWQDFHYYHEVGKYKCPNGKFINRQSLNHKVRNKVYYYYRAKEADCRECLLRSKCLSQKKGKARALLIPLGYIGKKAKPLSLSQKMKEKIDTEQGKVIYSKRFATVEPVFANIRSQKRLDRFTYRGKVKVNIQWMLYCIVHNIEKIMNYGLNG